MFLLFTDFGPAGPYPAQMKAVLCGNAPGIPVIDLLSDAPAHDPKAAAYLLAAYAGAFEPGSVFLCVVDPGVGSTRAAAVVEADGRWFVGPDNGIFELIQRRATIARRWHITWRPAHLSASFHGRDLFAPVAARIARGEPPPGELQPPAPRPGDDWPDDLAEIVYIDHFGNAVTGIRAGRLAPRTILTAAGRRVRRARTFGDVPAGEALWYENANGLAEIAVNRGRADARLGLRLGSVLAVGDGGK